MSHPPGLFDIGKLARAVSWASGPVNAGGRAVDVQMSTGTGGGKSLIPKTAKCLSNRKHLRESEFLSIRKKERVLNKGQCRCQSGSREPHIAASSYDFTRPTRGMAKNPWGILSQFGECEGEQGKGEILLRQVYGNILHVTDVESPYMLSCLLTPVAKWDRSI